MSDRRDIHGSEPGPPIPFPPDPGEPAPPIPEPIPGPEPDPGPPTPDPAPPEPERAAVLLRLAELPRTVVERRRRSTKLAGGLVRMSRPFTTERG
jgi:hypothetical protein